MDLTPSSAYKILPEWHDARRGYTSDWPELSASARLARRAEAVQYMSEIEAAYERGDLAQEIAQQVAVEKWADDLAAQLPPFTDAEARAAGALAREIDDRLNMEGE